MDKDEMKNRISMALKDPILQQGFEIICKNLAELGKENAELKKACGETQKLLDKQIEATYKLDKENAELKERLKEHESIGNAQFWENVWSWKTKADQLTKAKEIIKEVMNWYWETNICSYSMPTELRQKTEQFLNSEVEK